MGRGDGAARSGPAVSGRAAARGHRARALRRGARPADHQPARPHRPALVRREPALPRPGPALRRPRPLRLPHALLAGRAARPTSACRAPTAARPRPTAAGSGAASPRTTTCSAAPRRGSGSTTPSRRCSASTTRLSAETADHYYDQIADCLAQPEFRPRALFERFNIEAIATTESALDDLRWHRMIRDSGWDGRVVTAYRPDAVVDPEFEGFAANVARLGEITGCDTATWAGYLDAHRKRRAFFKEFGATSSDHGHPTARTEDLPQAEAAALFAKALAGRRDARGGRRLPRPDADRDGAHEPRRRPRAADPSRLLAQPLGRGLRDLRPRQGLRHPDAAPTSSAR